MKLLFASDIHGSKYYAELLINAFVEEKADKLILLGDLLYHGPRNPLTRDYNPMEVANLLNKYKEKIIAVRGNCDSEVDQLVCEFPMMSTYTQLVVDNFSFFLTHGHLYNPENLPHLVNNTIFVFGHIHIPIATFENNIYFLNPSSISLPKENNPSSYAIYEYGKIEIKTFDHLIIRELIL
ncbi:MAG: putative phosphoesterase [Haloplasmataceae bacterium]|jgi:putative phosphoesterase|nr:putative phosphoesterase [Haloplasmataceae bacterium]